MVFLKEGVSLETVSILLGHASIRVTRAHYSPFVKSWKVARTPFTQSDLPSRFSKE